MQKYGKEVVLPVLGENPALTIEKSLEKMLQEKVFVNLLFLFRFFCFVVAIAVADGYIH